MSITLQPVRVATGSADEEGCLVFADARLIALLVRLSEQHENFAGHWFLEAGFGRLDGTEHPIFPDIEAATVWLDERLSRFHLGG